MIAPRSRAIDVAYSMGWMFPRRQGSYATTEVSYNPALLHVMTPVGAVLSAPGCL